MALPIDLIISMHMRLTEPILNGRSHDAFATAIYVLQLIGCTNLVQLSQSYHVNIHTKYHAGHLLR